MGSRRATLYMLCGKVAAGKSTLAAELVTKTGAVLVAEDTWLGALYKGEISSANDFVQRSRQLRAAMAPHLSDLLQAGTSVVLDFQANTVESRKWMRGVFEAANANHELHVLNPPDDVCLARLHARNAKGDHPFAATDEQFHLFNRHVVLPGPEEGFILVHHT